MLEFRLHEIRLPRWRYLLLPKLNRAQVAAAAKALEAEGYRVTPGWTMQARKGASSLYIDPVGLCWAAQDPTDIVAPLVPRLLELEKEKASVDSMCGFYYRVRKSGADAYATLSLRLEGSPAWRTLRGAGLSGLTPDEGEVARALIRSSKGCVLLTDYPLPTCRPRMFGGRQYFESEVSPDDAECTLSVVGLTKTRNSFVPKGGVLFLRGFKAPSERDFVRLFQSMGQWCYFVAKAS